MPYSDNPKSPSSLTELSRSNYEVGYGKPPQEARFTPGQSGNTRGRPKGRKSPRALLERALSAPITITENGRARSVQQRDVLFRSLIGKALKGDAGSTALLVKLMEKRGLDREHEPITTIERYNVTPDGRRAGLK